MSREIKDFNNWWKFMIMIWVFTSFTQVVLNHMQASDIKQLEERFAKLELLNQG